MALGLKSCVGQRLKNFTSLASVNCKKALLMKVYSFLSGLFLLLFMCITLPWANIHKSTEAEKPFYCTFGLPEAKPLNG